MTTMLTPATPPRTYEQRMTALGRAQMIRIYRAQLKREIRAGRLDVVDLLGDPLCDTMKVGDALIAKRSIGKVKRNKLLNKLGISPGRSFGGLTERQSDGLIELLRR